MEYVVLIISVNMNMCKASLALILTTVILNQMGGGHAQKDPSLHACILYH